MDIELTDALEITPSKTATVITPRQVSIFYGSPDDEGQIINGVKIALNCFTGAMSHQTAISLDGVEADQFIDAISKLVEAAILAKFKISEGMRK